VPTVTAETARAGARLFGWVRIAIGVVLLVAPTLWSRAGFGQAPSNQALTAVRSAAARDLALGYGALAADDDVALVRWVEAGAIIDGIDAYALAKATEMRTPLRLLVGASAVGATASALVLRRALRS
jgi:hypothetical protein